MLKRFTSEYVRILGANAHAHVVMLVDFDGQFAARMPQFAAAIPQGMKDRVFVIGSDQTPETLRQALGMSYERIGKDLAEDCHGQTTALWAHVQLAHNVPECQRMTNSIRPILFGSP